MRLILLILAFSAVLNLTAQDFRYGKISKEELQEKQHPEYPEATAAILSRENHSRFAYTQDAGFVLESDYVERVKIYSSEGFKYATKKLVLFKNSNEQESVHGLKAVSYNLVDGKIEETRLDKRDIFKEEKSQYQNTLSFTMPNLKEGTIIEYKYTVSSPFLGNLDEVRFQEQIPVNRAEAQYYFPEYFVFKMHRKGWLPLDIKESSRNRKLNLGTSFSRSSGGGFSAVRSVARNRRIEMSEKSYDINITNAPPLVEEQFSGNINNYASAVKFELSYIKFPQEPLEYVSSTWEDVAKTIYDSNAFGKELSRTTYFADEIDALMSGEGSRTDKMNRIFNFVKNRMTWNSYIGYYAEEGLRDAYKQQSGNTADINLMLVAMLRYAGFEANPVLISTKSHGIPLFPTRNGFNYVVAGVKTAQQQVLMDATSKTAQPNLLDEELLNWNGRLIRQDGTSEWVALAPAQHTVKNMMISVKLDENMHANATAQGRLSGYLAKHYRKQFSNADADQKRALLEELNKGVELAEIHFEDLDKLDRPVSLSYAFEPLTSIERVGEKVLISPMFHLAMEANPFKSEERQFPIDFQYPRKNKYMISIMIPEGYKVERLPENSVVKLYDTLGAFSYHVNKTPTGPIQILCEQSINTSMMRAEAYEELKKFYDMIVQKEHEKIVLTKI